MPTAETLLTILRTIGYVGSALWLLCVVAWMWCFILEVFHPWPRWWTERKRKDDDR